MSTYKGLSDRATATIVGALFIIGTVAGALSAMVTNPILNTDDYVAQIAAHPNQMVVGALLVLTMGFALAMVPIVFYPVGRRYRRVLALGYVIFRGALETVTYIIGALGWLTLIAVCTKPATAAGPIAGYLKTFESVLWDQMIAIPFILGAMMFYYLLYESRLVPRWLSIWGLAGAVLYIVAPLTDMFGLSFGWLMAPLAVQEMVMGLWLIVKGFNAPETSIEPRFASATAGASE